MVAPSASTVTLRTADGVELRGTWRRTTAARATAVVVHGFAASIEDPGIQELATQLGAAGFDVLLYDARGHGASGGRCAVGSAEHHDVAAAAAAAAGSGLPVVLVGISMGVVAVSRYLAEEPEGHVVGAVLVSGPARWRMRPSAVGVLTAVLTKTALGRAVAERKLRVRIAPGWRTGEAPEVLLGRVTLPVAVVHGKADRLLSSEHGTRLHRSAGGPVRLDIVAGMGHGVRDSGWPSVVGAAEWVTAARPPTAAALADSASVPTR